MFSSLAKIQRICYIFSIYPSHVREFPCRMCLLPPNSSSKIYQISKPSFNAQFDPNGYFYPLISHQY
ncbi:hypothetical protein EYC80_006039 [Monilinia laxa]|uniref:Uncharacterized protein n=1 Tax=Monilinia laxa TaxID=61186 RepID=A0A5N6KFX5_MONLA|nr:hypothetical protein EYC80_006039 [Monilinia laxa]